MPKPNATVSAAQGSARDVRIEWFIKEVSNKVRLTIKQRVSIVTEHVRDKVVRNISRPVTVTTGPRGGRVVTNRSKTGEFPKADWTQLMKTIFSDMRSSKGGMVWDGFIGTPIDYGVILETSQKLDRSFLVRTLREQTSIIRRILTGPIR